MAKSNRARNGSSSSKTSEPIGGRYYPRYSRAVSGEFIESLRDEGVSGGTIHAIRRESAKRGASRDRGATRGAATSD